MVQHLWRERYFVHTDQPLSGRWWLIMLTFLSVTAMHMVSKQMLLPERLPVYIWKNGSQTGTSAAIMSGIFCKILQFQLTQVFWPRWPLIMSTFLFVQRKGHFRKGLPRHCWLYKGQSLWWMRGWGQCKQTKKAFQLIKDLFIAIFKRNTNLVISVHIHITKEKISERRDKRCWYISEMHRTCCQQVLFLHSECGV